MIRRPPRSTRTDTLFPYTTLFRSAKAPKPVTLEDNFTRSFRARHDTPLNRNRSEEHTSELQSLMRISYAVFCLKKKKPQTIITKTTHHISKHHILYQHTIIHIRYS